MFEQPPFLRTREVARLCGVRPEAVRALVRRGALRPIRLGPRGWLRFRREEVERLLQQDGAAANGGQSTRAGGSAAVSARPSAAARPTTAGGKR